MKRSIVIIMMIFNQIKNLVHKYGNIGNLSKKELFLFGIIIFVTKLLMVLTISYFDWSEGLSFYTNAGDDGQYIGYSENLFQTGEYFYDFGNSGSKDYFFRMPGITFLYLPLRFIFSQTVTINLVVILQVLLATFATLKFLELANKYFKVNNLLFLIFSVFYFYSAYLESSLMTESLGLSSLLLCIFYLDKALCIQELKAVKKYLIIGGLFLTWLIFLRPYMVPFIFVFLVYIFLKKRKFLYVLFFLFPFLIIDGFWVCRNYVIDNELIVLQKGLNWQDKVSKSMSSKYNFLKNFGFKMVYFEEDNHATWFNSEIEAPLVKIPPNSIFPERTFIGGLTIDSLIKARSLMHKAIDVRLDGKTRLDSDIEAARILDEFVLKLKEEYPFDYYIGNRIRILLKFIEPNTPNVIIHGPYPFNIVSSKLEVIFGILIKYGGLLSLMILFLFNFRKQSKLFLFFSVPIYIFVLFPLTLQINEVRYFYLAYPFLLLLLLHLFSFIKKRENG